MPDKGITDSELKQLLESMRVPIHVSMLSPLDIYVNTASLRTMVRESLKHLEQSRGDPHMEVKAIEYAIQQRIDFLAWLQNSNEPDVLMSMYPADSPEAGDLTELFDQLGDL